MLKLKKFRLICGEQMTLNLPNGNHYLRGGGGGSSLSWVPVSRPLEDLR